MQISIDNILYNFKKGETVLEIAKRNGINIPTLCNDDRLKPYSSCFVCVVEIEGMRGMQPSCSTVARDGMVVKSNNEKVFKARQTALNLLLSNHYADCYAPCKNTCPAGVDVQGYISLIEKGKYREAVALIKETNPLPAICGRVCVRPCEVACRRNLADEGEPVGIDYLKRFVADADLNVDYPLLPPIAPETQKKVAVIGAGPGGLSAAYFLRLQGHNVSIYESSAAAGGWLRYGIPEYRLPNNIIDQEVKRITDLGVNIVYDSRLGDNLSYKEIADKYDSTVLAIGAQQGSLVGCKGDDAKGVYAGITVLRQMEESGEKLDFSGKTVAVIGGGNTAMDCCRTAIRCGAAKVYVLYRRTEKEMPANPIEIHESKLEGVEYKFLTAPAEIKKDEYDNVCAITCLQMELGTPDASGRRRPVPVENSEFDVAVDFVMAAIGQKADVEFVDNINENLADETLELSKWGFIDADNNTLQTSVKNIFACGDGVTGPATLIQAVGQARIAANSCHQYLMGQEVTPLPYEFVSKKDNFKKQEKEDYLHRFVKQQRQEMPVLSANERKNFKEVELGYANENVALEEANRCLECGCTAVYSCDLKKYATEYNATQDIFKGDFKSRNIDFSHPYIEIDNNKCILCSRCVRTCSEIVGANALGLIERGFDTFVAPAGEGSLSDTNCESCGMCVSACPTGALTINTSFKPGPIKTKSTTTICNQCSVGCELEIKHKDGFVYEVDGSKGIVNTDGSVCGKARFGYYDINSKKRIKRPLKKQNGEFVEISFEEAYQIIADKMTANSAFFVSPRHTTEELALIKKLACDVVKTNNIGSLQYPNGVNGYSKNYVNNVPLSDITKAKMIYTFGVDMATDSPVVGYMMNKVHCDKQVPIYSYSTKENYISGYKCNEVVKILSYLDFIKAANFFLVKDNVVRLYDENKQILEDIGHYDIDSLVKNSGIQEGIIKQFANEFFKSSNAILVYNEKEICGECCLEIHKLALLAGKTGEDGNGIISLKTYNNSQGMMNLQMCNDVSSFTSRDEINSVFFFDEDISEKNMNDNISSIVEKSDFVMAQICYTTKKMDFIDLIMPASFAIELEGHYTNTQCITQVIKPVLPSGIKDDNIEQLKQIIKIKD